jgi:DNA-binding MarR family transcriptional regulator
MSAESLDVADRLHSAAIHLLRRLRRVDEASGLSAPRLSALSVLVFGGPMTLGALAAAEQVRPPTMTRVVRDLERAGLVERREHERDGRSVVLSATERGVALMREGRSRRVEQLARALARLAPEDARLLSRAATLLEEIAVAPGDG